MNDTHMAIDLAKSVFQVAVSHHLGRVAEERRLSRRRFERFIAIQEPTLFLLEACGSAHHWGRRLLDLGHTVVLLPPQYVRPYVRRNKTDRADARALLEAYRNEDIKPVPVKTVDQHTLAALHRMRSAWLATRTARLNAIRGFLRELGFFIPQGARHVIPRVHELIGSSPAVLPQPLQVTLAEMSREIGELEQRLLAVERQLRSLARENHVVKQLMTIPGVGLLTATALVAFVGNVHRFPSGRHFASYLGLTPRERSSGGTQRLGRISKQGDAYIRMLLTHGARAVLSAAKRRQEPDRLRSWALAREHLRGHNKAAIALANKLARIIWAVWRENRSFTVEHPVAA